jgi:hypothetical protein
MAETNMRRGLIGALKCGAGREIWQEDGLGELEVGDNIKLRGFVFHQ